MLWSACQLKTCVKIIFVVGRRLRLSNYPAEYKTAFLHADLHCQVKQFHRETQNWCPSITDCSDNFRKYLKYSLPLNKLRQQMDVQILLPPCSVRGMLELDRDAFQKTVTVPQVTVESRVMSRALKKVKKCLLKLDKFKPVETCEENPEMRVIILNPVLVKNVEDIGKDLQEMLDSGEVTFGTKEIVLNYENWKAEDILRAVLPENLESGGQGYSIVGHILHLNLRDAMLPYKRLIGQVLLDKVQNVSLVVNKTNIIDSTYRNFQMETVAGTGETVVTVKENGSSFTFDFAKVYWNPRLSTEHERIVKQLNFGDVLYDVMAGVGPFAIPAGRRKCCVLANDLNPNSYEYLLKNCTSNKVVNMVKCYNLDGNEFIKTVVKYDMLKKWGDPDFCGKIHITMNLPALAVEFLPSFKGLMKDVDIPSKITLPLVHIYMFTPNTEEDTAIAMVAEQFGYQINSPKQEEKAENSTKTYESEFGSLRNNVEEVYHVRQVAPNKAMMRVSLRLSKEILVDCASEKESPPSKKLKVDKN